MTSFLLEWWRQSAWPWLRENWWWVLFFPVAIVVYLTGRGHGRVVVMNARRDTEEVLKNARAIERSRDVQLQQLSEERVRKVEEVLEAHRRVVESLEKEQLDEVDKLREDPEALTAFLLRVGRRDD